MGLLSIRSYARQAYKNRYGFDSVTVDKQGNISGRWGDGTLPASRLGNIADCTTSVNPNLTGLCFHNRHILIYTFELPAGAHRDLVRQDGRYSIAQEGTGNPSATWVVRFQGERIESAATENEAWRRAAILQSARLACLANHTAQEEA